MTSTDKKEAHSDGFHFSFLLFYSIICETLKAGKKTLKDTFSDVNVFLFVCYEFQENYRMISNHQIKTLLSLCFHIDMHYCYHFS